IDDFLQPPGEGLDVADEIGVGAERVEVYSIRLERRVQPHALERLRGDAEAFVAIPVFMTEIAGLIEKAQIRTFDVEADGRDAALVRREVREDGREQELHGAGLRR